MFPPAPDPCDPNPCENDGKCTGTGDGGYSCECYPDFTGKHCEIMITTTTTTTEGNVYADTSTGFHVQ